MKNFFRTIHLYLGLAAGLIVIITCFTGAVLVFEKELAQAFHPHRYRVAEKAHKLSLQELTLQFKAAVPEAKINSLKIYTDPGRSVEISYSQNKNRDGGVKPSKKNAQKEKGGEKNEGGRKTAFINPYTGKIIELYNYQESYFYLMMDLHRWLLGGSIGKLVVGIATLFFVFILLTGFILWWPKTRAVFEKRFKIKWDGNWKRLNHDFHIVLGFYSGIFLFLFASTGLAWSFDWFNKGIYVVTRSEMKPPKKVESVYVPNKSLFSVDSALLPFEDELRKVQSFQLSFPKDSAGTYTLNALPKNAYEMQSINYYIDAYTGKLLEKQTFGDKNLGQQVRASFKPIHTASIFGLPSKIIGFIVCLLGVSFPITGFILWRNRVNAKK